MKSKNIACSNCYGAGYGVDGAACPCGCRAAANAGPPPGDYPSDRAIKALPLPQFPVMPPICKEGGGTPVPGEPKQEYRLEFLELAMECGALLTGKPDGSEAIAVHFTMDAWRKFDVRTAQPARAVPFPIDECSHAEDIAADGVRALLEASEGLSR